MMQLVLLCLFISSTLSAGLERSGHQGSRPGIAPLLMLTGVNLAVLPLFALGFSSALGLVDSERDALMYCMACAGGSSSPAVAALGKARVGITGSMAVVLSAASAGAAVVWSAARLDVLAVLCAQCLLLFIGVSLAARAPEFAQRLRGFVSRLSVIALVVAVIGLFALHGADLRTQRAVALAGGALLAVASLTGGWLAMYRWPALRAAGAIASGVRNLSLALVFAAPHPRLTAGILSYGLMMYLWSLVFALGLRAH